MVHLGTVTTDQSYTHICNTVIQNMAIQYLSRSTYVSCNTFNTEASRKLYFTSLSKVKFNLKIIVFLLTLAYTVYYNFKDNWKVVTGVGVHWTYSSSCSSAISALEPRSSKHSRSSISSVVELARFLVNHGGLLN